jgi:hypothetical protein
MSLHREHREFDYQSPVVGQYPPAERAATRDDEIRRSGNRFGRYLRVERVGPGREQSE